MLRVYSYRQSTERSILTPETFWATHPSKQATFFAVQVDFTLRQSVYAQTNFGNASFDRETNNYVETPTALASCLRTTFSYCLNQKANYNGLVLNHLQKFRAT